MIDTELVIWKGLCHARFEEHLPHDPLNIGVAPMVESCAALIKGRLEADGGLFSEVDRISVRPASTRELASHLFDAWADEIGSAFDFTNEVKPYQTSTYHADKNSIEIASEIYGTLIERLATWSVSQFELMLPQRPQLELLVPWKNILELSISAHCDPGMLMSMILIESMISLTMVNSEPYANHCLDLWRPALAFEHVNVDLFLASTFDKDLREAGALLLDDLPLHIENPKALINAFSEGRRGEAIDRFHELSAEMFAAVRAITIDVATNIFGVEALHLQHILDQYRIDAPDIAHLLQAGIGTSVCSNPWTKSLAKYTHTLGNGGRDAIIDSLHTLASRLVQT